ncbi:hypothetical protein ACQJBY_061229 [Aegilops geniculata]
MHLYFKSTTSVKEKSNEMATVDVPSRKSNIDNSQGMKCNGEREEGESKFLGYHSLSSATIIKRYSDNEVKEEANDVVEHTMSCTDAHKLLTRNELKEKAYSKVEEKHAMNFADISLGNIHNEKNQEEKSKMMEQYGIAFVVASQCNNHNVEQEKVPKLVDDLAMLSNDVIKNIDHDEEHKGHKSKVLKEQAIASTSVRNTGEDCPRALKTRKFEGMSFLIEIERTSKVVAMRTRKKTESNSCFKNSKIGTFSNPILIDSSESETD